MAKEQMKEARRLEREAAEAEREEKRRMRALEQEEYEAQKVRKG